MKKVVILIGGCRYNRGSEAMVRGCIKAIRKNNQDVNLIVSSKDDNTGNSLNLEGVDKYIRRFTYDRNNKLIRYTIGVLRYILHLKHMTNWINHKTLLKECEDADLVIVVGGDNYDKAYGAFKDMHSFNKTLRKTTKGKMVLLNCSINPNEVDEKIIKDLLMFDKVTIREQVTYSKILEYVPQELVEYYPDIAFIMEPKAVELPKCFANGDVVGLNLSPLILKSDYTNNSDVVLREYEAVIEYITSEMNKQVLLIPHVMNGADLSVLKKLYKKFERDDSVYLLDGEEVSSPELKYIISNCYLYFGARTHSTIAAYGSCVPTLVLGYSVKSVGIARDLFGTEDGYVLPIQKVSNYGEVLSVFKEFVTKRDAVKGYLDMTIPKYLDKAETYSDFFVRILGEKNDRKQ